MSDRDRKRRCRSQHPDDPSVQCAGEVTEYTKHIEDHWAAGPDGTTLRWPDGPWSPAVTPLPVANPGRVKAGEEQLTPAQRARLDLLREVAPGWVCANCRHESGRHSQGGCSVGFASNSPCGCPMEYDKVRGHLVDPPRSARDQQVGGDHYRKHAIQVWDIVDEYGLSYYAGLALKYLLRAGEKGPKAEDLKKARHVLDRMIEKEE